MNKSYEKIEDAELVALIKNEEIPAYEYLFRTWYTPLFRFCLKFVRIEEIAEELVQEVFIYMWEKRAALELKSSIKSYLFTAVKNKSYDYLKSKYAQTTFQSELLGDDQPRVSLVEEEFDNKELAGIIRDGINQLPEKCRIIFTMSREGGMTYNEIAEELNLSPKTVKAQIGIGIQKLKAYLGTYWDKIILLIFSVLHIFSDFF